MKCTTLFSLPAVFLLLLGFCAQSRAENAGNDPSLIFHASFDSFTTTADKAAGVPVSSAAGVRDLQLRMHAGADGGGNALELANGERCTWSSEKNFSPKQGTVSMWISPANWAPSKKKFQIFFFANLSGNYRMLIYKFIDPAYLKFTILHKGKDYSINVPLDDAEWTSGKWHRLDAAWDSTRMLLYLDGRLAKQLPYTKNPLVFPKDPEFPEHGKMASFGIGSEGSFNVDRNDKTVFDEVRIYNRMLSPEEILSEYEKIIPPPLKNEDKPSASIPSGSAPVIDGTPSPEEWRDATVFPVINPLSQGSAQGPFSRFFVKQDSRFFYFAAESFAPASRYSVSGRDNPDIWRDDSFEIHLINPANKFYYQFIVNSNGAFFDSSEAMKNGVFDPSVSDCSWESGAKYAAVRTDSGWSAEIAIPKAALGPETPEFFANFCRTAYGENPSFATWGPGCLYYFSSGRFGKLRTSGKAVRLESFENRAGECKVNFDGSSVEVRNDSGMLFLPVDGKLELPSGNYSLLCRDGMDFSYSHRFPVRKAMGLSYRVLPSKKTVEAKIDLQQAGRALRASAEAGIPSGIFLEDSSGKAVSAREFSVSGLENTVELPLPDALPAGEYRLRAALRTKDGEISESRKLRIPDMTPYRERIAADHSVPPPWTPVKEVSSGTFELSGKTFVFEKSPFPAKILAGKDTLLKREPSVEVNGAPVAWSGLRVLERHDDFVVLEASGSVGELRFVCRSELWFDGFLRCRMSVSPDSPVRLDSLGLSWSVPSEFSEYLLDPVYRDWNNRDGEKLQLAYEHPADFLIWTLGREKGLCWHPASSANYVLPVGMKPFSIERKGGETSVSAVMIGKKAVLSKPAVYEFAFMATPGKAPMKDWRSLNNGDLWGYLKYETFKINGYGVQQDPFPFDFEPWTGLIPAHPEKFQAYAEETIAKGSRFMPYSQPCYISDLEPDYDYFFPECEQRPGLSTGRAWSFRQKRWYDSQAVCGNTALADLFVFRANKFLDDYPLAAGLYYDICEGRICYNTLHGHGGIDAFGKDYSDSTLFAMRDFFLRIAKVVKAHGRHLMLHAHNRFVPFVHGLGDSWFPGEQYVSAVHRNPDHFYCEGIPLREYQSAYYSEARGVAVSFFSQLRRQGWVYPGTPMLNDEKHTRMFLAPLMIHDIGIAASESHVKTIEKWWILRHDLNLKDAEFRGYWFDKSFSVNAPDVYASHYRLKNAPYRYLLIVSNLGRSDGRVTVTADSTVKGASFTDLWTGEAVPSLKDLSVKSNDFRIIGIK